MNTMGELLFVERKVRHMTQKEMAACLGVSNATLSKWENGTRQPYISMYDFFRWCEKLELHPGGIITYLFKEVAKREKKKGDKV